VKYGENTWPNDDTASEEKLSYTTAMKLIIKYITKKTTSLIRPLAMILYLIMFHPLARSAEISRKNAVANK
jgi:hypothetical protein